MCCTNGMHALISKSTEEFCLPVVVLGSRSVPPQEQNGQATPRTCHSLSCEHVSMAAGCRRGPEVTYDYFRSTAAALPDGEIGADAVPTVGWKRFFVEAVFGRARVARAGSGGRPSSPGAPPPARGHQGRGRALSPRPPRAGPRAGVPGRRRWRPDLRPRRPSAPRSARPGRSAVSVAPQRP